MQTVVETKEDLSRIFEIARREGKVRIRRPNGDMFVIEADNAPASSLDVEGLDLGLTAHEIVAIVREGRER
jgi:hypothetical protein